MPEYRPVAERIHDWKELPVALSAEKIQGQGERCLDCGVPFCQSSSPTSNGCPVENLIPDWNGLVLRGKWKEALKALHSTNNFPEFTGKLCPAPCESACVLGLNSDSVTIRNIESSIIDRGFKEGWVQPLIASERTGKKVAIIGSGPAGLAAAQQLARAGHEVTVFEKAAKPGGLLRYGIPDFKMEKWVLDRRLEQLKAEGVVFKNGIEVGVDYSKEELLGSFDAVCLTLGAPTPRDLPVPGRDLAGVHQAMDYLTSHFGSGQAIDAHGKRVIILGGGDTGADCLGTAIRQGCASVMQFELLPKPPRERAETTPWPLWPLQLRTSAAHEEGTSINCERRWGVLTTHFSGENGILSSLHGRDLEVPADLVILALGFSGPNRKGLIESLQLKLDPRGNVLTDGNFETSHPKVFAAGDVHRGASLIVWAIAEGRKMAAVVDKRLKMLTLKSVLLKSTHKTFLTHGNN